MLLKILLIYDIREKCGGSTQEYRYVHFYAGAVVILEKLGRIGTYRLRSLRNDAYTTERIKIRLCRHIGFRLDTPSLTFSFRSSR